MIRSVYSYKMEVGTMTNINNTVWCDGCGVEIVGAPIIRTKQYYCCEDCFQGIKCSCGERMELEEQGEEESTPSYPDL